MQGFCEMQHYFTLGDWHIKIVAYQPVSVKVNCQFPASDYFIILIREAIMMCSCQVGVIMDQQTSILPKKVQNKAMKSHKSSCKIWCKEIKQNTPFSIECGERKQNTIQEIIQDNSIVVLVIMAVLLTFYLWWFR